MERADACAGVAGWGSGAAPRTSTGSQGPGSSSEHPPHWGLSDTAGITGTMCLIQPPRVLCVKAQHPQAGQVLLAFFCIQAKPCAKEETCFKNYF